MPSKQEYWSNPEKFRRGTRAYALAHPEWKQRTGREWARKKRACQTLDERQAAGRRARGRDPIGYLLDHARKRAQQQNLPFDLEREDLTMPEICPVLGLTFEWGAGKMGWRNMRAPSLDRIRPQLGYTKVNVRIISTRANHLKNNGTISEIEAVLAYMRREGANWDLSEQETVPRVIVPSPQLDMGW